MLSKFINLFKFACCHPLNYNSRLDTIVELNVKFSSVDNTLYLRKINEVKQRISKKSICILGNGKKI
tara:strand:- start:92 stop:292 length:201 start_codon:yes stop_codon:yes gene_type:complete